MLAPLPTRLSRFRAIGELRLLDRYRMLGFAGALALAVGGIGAGALPRDDPFARFRIVDWLQASEPLALAVGYAGLALLVVAWLFLGRRVGTPEGPGRRSLLATLALWSAPLCLAPPMFSRDVYSYGAVGWMVHDGASPYFWGPGAIPDNPYLADVPDLWTHTPTPYGPAFLQLARWVVDVSGDRTVPTVLGMRLLALVGVLLLVRYVPRLARHCGVPADRALWLAVLNPLVLFHFVSGAHNDALLMGLMVAGLVLVMDRRSILGIVLVSLALLVKAPAALALVFIVPFWAQHLTGRWRLVRAAAGVGAISGAVIALVSWGTGLGYGWIGALNTPGTVRNWLSGTTLMGELVGVIAHYFGVGDDQFVMDKAIAVFRGAGGLAAVVIVLVLLARMDRRGFIASLGLGFVAVVALSPVVQPWYLLWGFVLIACGTSNLRSRTAVITASAALAVVVMPKGGTVDVSAIIQAVLCAAAVAGAAALFELLPGRTLSSGGPVLGGPRRPADGSDGSVGPDGSDGSDGSVGPDGSDHSGGGLRTVGAAASGPGAVREP
ncbi:MAG TPA: polyprenol phosphomannose-dependent alpha 1,6 mannosyltransferase MptB [Mycobacteriales bacterium]|nr:polyprenol phosphomannose-dependent alpha 1,6 mannosyltransferase MptB [Mycobacteriales bacterium]